MMWSYTKGYHQCNSTISRSLNALSVSTVLTIDCKWLTNPGPLKSQKNFSTFLSATAYYRETVWTVSQKRNVNQLQALQINERGGTETSWTVGKLEKVYHLAHKWFPLDLNSGSDLLRALVTLLYVLKVCGILSSLFGWLTLQDTSQAFVC